LYYPETNFIIDLDFGKSADGTKIQLWTFGHCQNQYWAVESVAPPPPLKPYSFNTDYAFVNKRGGTAITLQSDGVNVAGDPLTWELEQFWVLEPGTGNYVYIRSEGRKYWSIANSPENGERIVLGNNKQNWDIKQDPQDPTAFRIFYPGKNYNVELHRGNSTPGTVVQLFAQWANDQQLWRFRTPGA